MQIYLPHKNYVQCAKSLSDRDLIKQRENSYNLLMYLLHRSERSEISIDAKYYEKIINHPIFSMWWNNGNPYIGALVKYFDACNFELFERGYGKLKYPLIDRINIVDEIFQQGSPQTPKRITSGYRVILLCNDENYYKNKFYRTYLRNKEIIQSLRQSNEKFKFSKFLGLRIP